MSQDNQFNFYLGAPHDKRKTVNQQVKNFVLNDAFWIRYDQERSYKKKSKIAEEVLDFVYENGGRLHRYDKRRKTIETITKDNLMDQPTKTFRVTDAINN